MRPLTPTVGTLSTSVAILLCAGLAPCQGEAAAVVTKQGSTGPSTGMAEWPSNMLLVGTEGQACQVPMGTASDIALKWAQFFFPHNKRLALKALKNSRSELGEAEISTAPFFLSKFAVTNEQYYRFIKATGHRFPFHWWREGASEDFESHRSKIYKAFPDLKAGDRVNAPVYYWEDFWKSEKLAFAVPEGQEKYPVNFVSWKDALQDRAWAGMRLPTEVEWTFAANGGQRKDFIFGNEWDDGILKQLRMADLRDIKLKPVGALGPKATGPFGHADMVGQVWEWVIPLGYTAQTSQKLFESEYRKLRKDKKFGKELPAAANFKPELAIAKGGSFFTFSNQDFIQARINCRAPLDTEQTLAGLGFRVAKTKRPAYDMSLSRLRGGDYPPFLPGNKEPSLDRQIGWERYDLEGSGEIIANYHGVSLIPINYLSIKKNPRLPQIRDESQRRPFELGVLITTEEMAKPALQPGSYVVYLRRAGIPKELKDALSAGHKALVAVDKAKKRAEKEAAKKGTDTKKKPKKEKKKKAAKKDSVNKPVKWQQILRRYGYSNAEVVANKPKDLAKYVYLRHTGNPEKGKEWFKVSTETNQLIFRHKSGKWTTAMDTKVDYAGIISSDPQQTITAPNGGLLQVSFSVPVDQAQMKKKRRQRAMQFKIDLQMK